MNESLTSWMHNDCVVFGLHYYDVIVGAIASHQSHDCLLHHLFRRRSKKTSKLRVTGLCEGNSPETGEFPAQRDSNAENVSIWWRHHEIMPRDRDNYDLYSIVANILVRATGDYTKALFKCRLQLKFSFVCGINSLVLGTAIVIVLVLFKVMSRIDICWIFPVKSSSGESHKTSPIISQHWII